MSTERDPLTDTIAAILSDAAKLVVMTGIIAGLFVVAMGGADILGRLQ